MTRIVQSFICVLLTCALILPARAQRLAVPLTGHRARPIAAETLLHTLFSDFFSEPDNTTYVQTGDIPAMWVRDSSAQTLPYVRFAAAYPILAARFAGVIERNARNVNVDPYANAFQAGYGVWERKWEAGSPGWFVLLAWVYRQETGRRNLFTPVFHTALRKLIDTWRCEQLHAQCSRYSFPGLDANAPYNAKTGMIWTAFRSSDDPARYPFNIPQQALIVIALQDAARLAVDGYGDANLANEANSMATQVYEGIERFGRVRTSSGWMYAYETDGLGHALLMDDANAPDLISLPYLGWCSAYDPTYLNTRNFVLSKSNPWYFSGLYAQGLGSPHTPYGFVWPLGIIMRGLTATSQTETSESITMLAETDAADGLMHESFWPDGYWLFTRADFGWANALYAELLFRSVAGFPATRFTADGRPVVPFELFSRTPVLTSLSVQLQNTQTVYDALGDLLQQADGHTIIPNIENYMRSTANQEGPTFHEIQDAH
ncbi:MAG TPA: glycoside hydrolase family 125 protein [Candidatus Baltobacteraceae bacterium]|nr:glycoside hydrolase family 125 protein [Candidatus Baltobacteraceae bacterium]